MSRSTTGCWTCRIRKKKRDETRPACTICTLRHLTCHGYGPKPSWMDNARNQKAEVEKIKRAVSQSYSIRRARRNQERSKSKLHIGEYRIDEQSSFGQPASDQSSFQATSISYLLHARQSAISLLSDAPRKNLLASGNELGSDVKPSSSSKDENLLDELSQYSLLSYSMDSSSNSLYNLLPPQEQIINSGLDTAPDVAKVENEHDLAMIVYYMDKVFPLQYYFYQPATGVLGRGWLLSLLLRSKPSYFVALAFSVLHQILFVCNGNSVKEQELLEEFDQYHSLSIRELYVYLDILPTLSGLDHLRLGAEILCCSIQLLSIEVFRETKLYKGYGQDWEVHLDASGALLSVIGSALRISGSPSYADGPIQSERFNKNGDVEKSDFLPLGETAGLDFLIASYIWCDIFRCTNIGSKNADPNAFPYFAYLQEDRIRLDHLMGCQNWVMAIIREIANLEAWKQEKRSRFSLSIPELCLQGAALEARLNSGLARLKRNESDGEEVNIIDRERILVTEINALSTLIYIS